MRKPLFNNFGPPISASKVNQRIMFVHPPSWTSFFSCYVHFSKNALWGPFQNPVGAKMGRKIDHVAPTNRKITILEAPFWPSRDTLKHGETPSGLGLRFVYLFRCLHFPI